MQLAATATVTVRRWVFWMVAVSQ